MKVLYDGKFAPITDTIGFLRCSSSRAAATFVDWQRGIQLERGVSLIESRFEGNLQTAIVRLLPLTSVEARRFLFVPTCSDWTAFFDNGHDGTDATPPMSFLAEKLSCETLSITFVSPNQDGEFPATTFELFGPRQTHFLNYVRSISAVCDGGTWEFSADGEVQPYEEVQKYKEKDIQNRFTGEMLGRYLRHLGISFFEEDFYFPRGQQAILVEKVGPIATGLQEFFLARSSG